MRACRWWSTTEVRYFETCTGGFSFAPNAVLLESCTLFLAGPGESSRKGPRVFRISPGVERRTIAERHRRSKGRLYRSPRGFGWRTSIAVLVSLDTRPTRVVGNNRVVNYRPMVTWDKTTYLENTPSEPATTGTGATSTAEGISTSDSAERIVPGMPTCFPGLRPGGGQSRFREPHKARGATNLIAGSAGAGARSKRPLGRSRSNQRHDNPYGAGPRRRAGATEAILPGKVVFAKSAGFNGSSPTVWASAIFPASAGRRPSFDRRAGRDAACFFRRRSLA